MFSVFKFKRFLDAGIRFDATASNRLEMPAASRNCPSRNPLLAVKQ